jgi:hypothetical protein
VCPHVDSFVRVSVMPTSAAIKDFNKKISRSREKSNIKLSSQATLRGHLLQASPAQSFVAIASPRAQRKPHSTKSFCLQRAYHNRALTSCAPRGRRAGAAHLLRLRGHVLLRGQVLLDMAVVPEVPLKEPLPHRRWDVRMRNLLIAPLKGRAHRRRRPARRRSRAMHRPRNWGAEFDR